MAEPFLGGAAATPTPALQVHEFDVSLTAGEGQHGGALDGVDAPWLRHLLAMDDVLDRQAASAALSLAMRLLHRGWQPLVDESRPEPATLLWAPPADCTIFVPQEPQSEPLAAIRPGAPEPAGVRVPDDVRLLLVGHDGGDPEALLELIVARGGGASRIWLASTQLSANTARWLREYARPVLPARAAA